MRAAALVERIVQRALHQAEPVAIRQHLVLGIDRGDGILQVLDGGDRGFQHHVGNAGGILLADLAACGRSRSPYAVRDAAAARRSARHRRRDSRQTAPGRAARSSSRPATSPKAPHHSAHTAPHRRGCRPQAGLPGRGWRGRARSPWRRGPCCSRRRGSRRHLPGSRRCRTARRTGCPSAHSPRSAHSAHWSPARQAAARRCWRSRHRHGRCRWRSPRVPAAGNRSRAGTVRYASWSIGWSRWARCQSSICCCNASRRSSSARLRGAKSRTSAPKPFQNDAGSTPVPGIASAETKWWSAWATRRPPASTYSSRPPEA